MRTALVVLLLTLAAGVVRAEGETVTLSVTDRPLAEVAASIAKQGKIVVVVDPDRAGKKVTLSMHDLPVMNAVEKAARVARGEVTRLATGAYWIGRKLEVWERRIQATLVVSSVRVNFEEKQVASALKFVSGEIGIPICIDPDITQNRLPSTLRVSLKKQKTPAREVLEALVKDLDLAFDVRWGVIYVASKERLASLPRSGLDRASGGYARPGAVAIRKRLASESLHFNMRGASATDVMDFIDKAGKVSIRMDEPVRKALHDAAMVSQKIDGVSYEQALDLVLIPRGFRYELTRDGVRIQPAE